MARRICWCWLVIIAMTEAEGYCLSNIARGKPALQSPTGFSAPAERAVDGNGDPNFGKRSCTFSKRDSSVNFAWWQVDLGGLFDIAAVSITNRADARVWRLNNFDVEIFTTDPRLDPSAVSVLCFTFPGSFGAVTKTLKCKQTITGRFVRVKKNDFAFDDALTLCEFAVHPNIQDPRNNCDSLQKRPYSFIPHSSTSISTSDTRTIYSDLMTCMVECFWQYACDGFNFNGTGNGFGHCQFVYVSLGKTSNTPGWVYYKGICES